MDDAGDDACDGRWMTYGELAHARGVTLRAAVRLTQRQHLRRQPGNDGKTLVWVPPDVATQVPRRDVTNGVADPDAGDNGSDVAPDVAPPVTAELSLEINALREALVAVRQAQDGELATLRQGLADAQAARDRAEARADKAEASLADERVRADQVRAQVDELRTQLAELRADDAARQARGLLARLLAAWRG
jgi:hypothetical protein